jgi:hypothetical protein
MLGPDIINPPVDINFERHRSGSSKAEEELAALFYEWNDATLSHRTVHQNA